MAVVWIAHASLSRSVSEQATCCMLNVACCRRALSTCHVDSAHLPADPPMADCPIDDDNRQETWPNVNCLPNLARKLCHNLLKAPPSAAKGKRHWEK